MTALESFPGRESRGKCNVFHHVVVSQDKRNMRKSCLAAPYLSRLLRSEFFLPSYPQPRDDCGRKTIRRRWLIDEVVGPAPARHPGF